MWCDMAYSVESASPTLLLYLSKHPMDSLIHFVPESKLGGMVGIGILSVV